MRSSLAQAFLSLAASLNKYELIGTLGWHDVRQRYRRSTLGPFWLTISMGVMIAVIGIVFGHIFKSPLKEFLPFVALGMIAWTLISTTITEGCLSFVSSESIIKQLPIPLFVYVLRVVWRNLIIFIHNLAIFPILMFLVGASFSWVNLLSIFGLLIVVINLVWIVLILSILCTRYRDLPQIIVSLLQVLFYLTPIMWAPQLLSETVNLNLLNLNPFYHLVTILRAPLLGQQPSLENWIGAMLFAAFGWIVAFVFYARYQRRITYWL